MFLKCLIIEHGSTIIRNITFRKGINLIVDETKTEDLKESGNNVGKTTVLRLIDFCLGGTGKNIYQDPEFRSKSNSTVETYLTSNNICVTLVLKEDLTTENSKELKIKRNFLSSGNKIIEINDEAVMTKNFPENLKSLVFRSSQKKPSFRQIISKNIRDEKNRLTNMVKVLHPTTKAEEYEALYLFWLGIDLDVSERKQKLLTDKKIEEDLQKRLKKENTISQIKQFLLVVDGEISDLEKMKNSLNIDENYEINIASLNEVKLELNRISTRMSRLKLREELINESITELSNELSTLNTTRIKNLYEEAKSLIPSVQKTFDDTLKFHNGMIREKKKYISKELPDIQTEIADLQNTFSLKLSREKHLSNTTKKMISTEKYSEIANKLNNAYENKGALEEQRRFWESSVKKLSDINKNIKKIDDGIDSLDDDIQTRVATFNQYFSKLSDELYGEKYVLSADKNEKGYELNISSLIGNPGTGKKKGEMAAFDLSYMQFADHMGIECLHFILQDQIENIHGNQINSILTDFVESNNCQYVLPVLRDKLPSNIDVTTYEVLSLSQDEKLFKI